MNKVFISGRLVRDVEKKTSKSGTEFTKVTVAVEKYMAKDKSTKTIFVDCIAFAHNANYLAKYCQKGTMVHIEGELDSSVVEKDGGKVTYWNVVINAVESAKPTQTETVIESNDVGVPFEI